MIDKFGKMFEERIPSFWTAAHEMRFQVNMAIFPVMLEQRLMEEKQEEQEDL
jgi:hypothetical protein